MNYDNIHKILSLWVDVQKTSDDPFTKELLGASFEENLLNVDLDPISRNLSDVIFSMDYDELVDHINSLELDEEHRLYILSELEEIK